MPTSRSLRKEAAALLQVAKEALVYLRDTPMTIDPEREALVNRLRSVIARADPPNFDDRLVTITMTMTNASADALLSAVKGMASSEEEIEMVQQVNEGLRRTKQRVYLTLDLNHELLKWLRYVLMHTTLTGRDRAFNRLIKEIEQNGLNKNPMEILGRMAL